MTDSARLASPSAEIPQVGGHSDGLEWAHCKTALSAQSIDLPLMLGTGGSRMPVVPRA
jgi:hypothetical protein